MGIRLDNSLSKAIAESDYVPYNNAIKDVNLGLNSISADTVYATSTGSSIFNEAIEIETMTIGEGSITDSTGAISFGNENLLTTGTFGSGAITTSGNLLFSTAGSKISFNNGNDTTSVYFEQTGYGLALHSDGANMEFHAGGGLMDFSDCDYTIMTAIQDEGGGIYLGLGVSSGAGILDIIASSAIYFASDGYQFSPITSNTDIAFNFIGTTNSGVLTWMEDENYFQFGDNINLGGATNYIKIATDGDITWGGTSKKKLTLRPELEQKSSLAGGIPTEVTRGLNTGYSMPIWSTPANQYELLCFRMRIPLRWDGTTDPQLGIVVSLSGAEDVGDKFKFQLDWQSSTEGEVIGTTTSTAYSEQAVLTGRAEAYDLYFVFFTFDADDVNNHINNGDMLQVCVKRIAASANEVSNEVIIWDWATMWCINKAYGDWSVETNDS